MPLKICYENIVKIVCNYHFLKKKSGMELWQWHCRIQFHFSQFKKFFFTPYFSNGIATNQLQKKKNSSYFSNAITIIPFHLLLFLRNDMCTQFLQYFYNKFSVAGCYC